MNRNRPKHTRPQMERRSLAQVQQFDGFLEAVVRERAGSEAEANLSSRLLSRMESAPEAVLKRQPRSRLLWLSGLAGLAAAAVVAVFWVHPPSGYSRDRSSKVLQAWHSPAAPLPADGRITQPVQQAKTTRPPLQRAPVLRVRLAALSIPPRNVAVSASEEAALPKLDTFPARRQPVALSHGTEAVPAIATEVVVVPAPAWETAELHIQPISMKALPSEKDPQ